MNYPLWELPAAGLLIAGISILHVFISHFAVGGGLFLVVAESRARRHGDGAMLGFLKGLSRFFILLTLVLGAITGVGIWFTITLVNPQATSALINTFVWCWAIEWTFFLTEIAAAMVYYYGWERLSPRTHLAVGWVYFVAAWASLAVIDGILSFMVTSGDWAHTRGLLDGFFNPSYFPTLVLRTGVAGGLAGLYVLLAGACVSDADLKGRIARYAGFGWVVPAAVVSAASFVWYLSVLARAGVPVAEALGAKGSGLGAVLAAALSLTPRSGQPILQHTMFGALAGSALLVLATLALVALRRRRYGRLEAGALMLIGFVVMGSGEWAREALRKPWVIDRYMFTNGVRLPAPDGVPGPPEALGADPFTVEALSAKGVLSSTAWVRVPAAYRPEDSAFASLPGAERAGLEAAAGAEVFRVLCSQCHTQTGYLAIRPLVQGQSVGAIDKVLVNLAKPVDAAGQPTRWSDPHLRLDTWLGRRMPPFTGTEAERRALAVYLARLGGDAAAGAEAAATAVRGPVLFEDNCAMCHGADGEWPIGARVKGKTAEELYELIGRLPQVNEAMPPFEGSDEERRALAEHLAALGKE
jgi:mono/diheme cytochrome c family protein/cytochrome bd-type quinol oxidase subunit 1